MADNETAFQSHMFVRQISELEIVFRVLKMDNSLFIYIGDSNNEIFDEIAVAMPLTNGDIVGTSVMGPLVGCDSKELAETFSKKLNKQVFISCNVCCEKFMRPMLAKHLSQEIETNPTFFKS